MAESNTQTEAGLVALLNDLLQLDHDAVGAYTVAIERVQREDYRQDLIRFRGDHQRHIADLTRLVRAHGGTPMEMPHLPSGAFKLAVQAAGSAGGDRALLLAFKSNEGQVRDKYGRAADGPHPPDVAEVLSRNAADEEKHYRWVSEAVDSMGAGPDTRAGRAEAAFESAHGRMADAMETGERKLMQGASAVRRSTGESPLLPILLGLGILLVLRRILR
ncbi:MAG: ferritin-like domain-containing protein [Gemmatimonadota bacterium]